MSAGSHVIYDLSHKDTNIVMAQVSRLTVCGRYFCDKTVDIHSKDHDLTDTNIYAQWRRSI